MAIPNDYIDKITNKDSGESRIISPAADKVRVDNENFEGTDLDEVLDEVAQAIGESGSGDGTVTGVKVGSTTYEPTDGVVDLSTPFAGKVDKVTGYGLSKNDYTDADKTAVGTIPSKANDAEVVKSISVNGGSAQTPTNGNVNIVVPSGGLTESDISVETQGDGTVDINVGSDSYTVNLNHTHPNMCKLIVCEESDLPSTLDEDTIYGVEEDGEISVLYVGGIPFYGGGGVNVPELRSPHDDDTVNMGYSDNGSTSQIIKIKGRHLSQPLTVELGSGSTGYSFDTSDLPTGVTYDSNTGKLTVGASAACSVNGVDIVVVYTGSAYDAAGTLGIASSELTGGCEVSLIANSTASAFAYWNGEDAAVSGKWVDRKNEIPFILSGTAAKTNDGYQFNNLSNVRAAYALTDQANTVDFNTAIKKEFTCYVDLKIKFTQADKNGYVIDFGAGGTSLSDIAIGIRLNQAGNIRLSIKKDRVTDDTVFSSIQKEASLSSAIATGSYATYRFKIGAKIRQDGKQEFYAESGSARVYAVLDTPVNINFNGCQQGYGSSAVQVTSAASLGLGYDNNASADFPSYLSDIIYQSIIIFNTAL